MTYLRYVLSFILLAGSILFCIRKLRFSQSLAPLIVILGNTLLLYVFSLINLLLPGAYILAGVNLILGILSFVNFHKHQNQGKFVPSLAIIAWIIIFFVLIVYVRGTLIYEWDEFDYWGAITRYLLATNHLPDLASNFLFISYPPFLAIFHYFVNLLVGKHESSSYFAQMLLSFSSIIAILPNVAWKDLKKFLLFLVVTILSVFALDFKFQSLYADLIVGLLFAVSLVSIGFDEELPADRFIVVLFSTIALAIIKPTSILFSLTALGLLFFKFARVNFQLNTPGNFLRSLLKPFRSIQFLLVLVLPVAAMISWSIHKAPFNSESIRFSLSDAANPSLDSLPWVPENYTGSLSDQELLMQTNHLLFDEPLLINISFKGLLNNFSAIADDRTKEIFDNFVAKLTSMTYYAFPITIAKTVIVILLASLLLKKLSSAKNLNESKFLSRAMQILAVGWTFYTFSLLIVYSYYFMATRALSAPSMDRYSASFLIGWWFFVLSFAYKYDSPEIPVLNFKSNDVIVGLLLVIFLFNIPAAKYLHLPFSPDSQRFAVSKIYTNIQHELNASNEKVYVIWGGDKSKGYTHLIMKYFLTPIPSNNFGWELGESALEYNLYKINFSPDAWMKLLHDQQYTHVLINSADYAFWDQYGGLFETFSREQSTQLFAVAPGKLIKVDLTSPSD